MSNSKFESWVKFIFDHPVGDEAWYWNYDGPSENISSSEAINFLTTLFETPLLFENYSNAQVNQGLGLLISSACSSCLPYYLFDSLFDESIDWQIRERCIDSMIILFRDVFLTRCSEKFSPKKWDQADPLDGGCFMWWDEVTSNGTTDEHPSKQKVRDKCLDVMGEILLLNARVCWWSALHGLGHWGSYNQTKANALIEDFLDRAQHVVGADMREYAKQAKEGAIQ